MNFTWDLYAISEGTAREAQRQIVGCDTCSSDAKIPLAWVLEGVIGRDSVDTEYILAEPLACPQCGASITEETLLEWD